MKDVTDKVRKTTFVMPGAELLWDKVRSSVVLFLHGEPTAFYSLDSPKDNEEEAITGAIKLVSGEGMKL